jgi:hypothetical protein
METAFVIGDKTMVLKYARKMSVKEVERMKSFVTNKGVKLVKTDKFKILTVNDSVSRRTYKVVL